MQLDWTDVMLKYYGILQIAIQTAKALGKLKRIFPKVHTIEEVKQGMESGDLHFGDKIKVIGTFSEYIPFLDPKLYLKKSKCLPRMLPRTTRLSVMDDIYCGAVFKLDQTDAFAQEVLPIFYGIDSRMSEHFTGEMLEMQCRITQVPVQYHSIINQNGYFTFEKEEGLLVPFGLKIQKVEPYGIVDSFRISSWLIGNLTPAPSFTPSKRKVCVNCGKSFSYMPLDPVDIPLKYGCTNYIEPATNAPKDVIKMTKDFLKLEKQGIPYLVFPEPFKLFEVFYPSVDIFDKEQKDHSKNVLIGTIRQNMQALFLKTPFPQRLKIPKKSVLSVDYQYDQMKRITEQNFDPKDVSKFVCPHYIPDPKKLEKERRLAISGKSSEENKFRIIDHSKGTTD